MASLQRAEFYSLSGDLRLIYILNEDAGPSKAMAVDFLKKEIERHLDNLSALNFQVNDLPNAQLQVLCRAQVTYKGEVWNGDKGPFRNAYLELISADINKEIASRQYEFGGRDCEIGGSNGASDLNILSSPKRP